MCVFVFAEFNDHYKELFTMGDNRFSTSVTFLFSGNPRAKVKARLTPADGATYFLDVAVKPSSASSEIFTNLLSITKQSDNSLFVKNAKEIIEKVKEIIEKAQEITERLQREKLCFITGAVLIIIFI